MAKSDVNSDSMRLMAIKLKVSNYQLNAKASIAIQNTFMNAMNEMLSIIIIGHKNLEELYVFDKCHIQLYEADQSRFNQQPKSMEYGDFRS